MTDTLHGLILRRLAAIKNEAVGLAIGHDGSHVCRIGSCERGVKIDELERFLGALGLRVIEVGGDSVTLPAEQVRALKVLARGGLRFLGESKTETVSE